MSGRTVIIIAAKTFIRKLLLIIGSKIIIGICLTIGIMIYLRSISLSSRLKIIMAVANAFFIACIGTRSSTGCTSSSGSRGNSACSLLRLLLLLQLLSAILAKFGTWFNFTSAISTEFSHFHRPLFLLL